MDRIGITQGVLQPMKPPEYHFEPENDRVAQLVERYPERFHSFGRIDPWRRENAEAEVTRIFEKLKLKGLFLHPQEEQFPLTHPVLRPIMELMKKYKKPVMFSGGHVRVSHPRQIEWLAAEYPDITFIATSGGQINISGLLMYDAEEMLTRCGNVYMETSGIYRRDFIELITKKLGAGRVLFGSGTPYFDQRFEMERIKTAEISEDERKMLLGGTAKELLS